MSMSKVLGKARAVATGDSQKPNMQTGEYKIHVLNSELTGLGVEPDPDVFSRCCYG